VFVGGGVNIGGAAGSGEPDGTGGSTFASAGEPGTDGGTGPGAATDRVCGLGVVAALGALDPPGCDNGIVALFRTGRGALVPPPRAFGFG
jgi:hypothetical protein